MNEVRHLTEHQISASVDGVLQGSSQEQVLRHLADCDECRSRYEELVEHHQMLAALLAHEADDAFFSALESDVEQALRAGDGGPRGVVVSLRNAYPEVAPSAPPAPARPAPPPVVRPEAVAPIPKLDVCPAPPSAPAPRHEFPDEVFEAEADEVAIEAGTARARGARGGLPILPTAIAAVAAITIVAVVVMLVRRGNEARPVADTSTSSATVSPTTAADLASEDPALASLPTDEPDEGEAPAPIAAPVAPVAPPKRVASPKPPTTADATPASRTTPAERASRRAGLAATADGPARMCGAVRDPDGNPIPRAQVLVSGTSLGAITDVSGRFCLTVSAGSHELRLSALGYVSGIQPVSVIPGMGELAITLRSSEVEP